MTYRTRQRSMQAPGFFWTPPDYVTGDMLKVVGPEARHAVTVCRLRKGEMMTVTDGEGNAYDCEIVSATPREVVGRIIREHRHLGEPIAQVTLAVGIGKPQSFDWIVEKAVELGAIRIIPVQADQSPAGIGGAPVARRKVERWRRLSLGAMKQCLRSVWPEITTVTSPGELAEMITDHDITWLADDDGVALGNAADSTPTPRRTVVIVGPEAGFTDAERRLLVEAGVRPIRLGSRRLRAETAAIAALTLVMHHLGEL
ncbi:MAG: RsmE family RNA methyltransferase [Candidatus Zixiibacteriota bacterium]